MTTSKKKSRKPAISPERKIATVILFTLLAVMLFIGLVGCKPIERIIIKTEYIDRLKVDTVNNTRFDSIYIREHGDTVEIYKTKYIDRYRVKIQKDTINNTDTLTVIVPGKPETKIIEKKGIIWWIGLIVLLTGLTYLIYKLVTWSPINSLIKKTFKLK